MKVILDPATLRIRLEPESPSEAEFLKFVGDKIRAAHVQDIKNNPAAALGRLATLANVAPETLRTRRDQSSAYRAALKLHHPDVNPQAEPGRLAEVLAVAAALGLRDDKEKTAPEK